MALVRQQLGSQNVYLLLTDVFENEKFMGRLIMVLSMVAIQKFHFINSRMSHDQKWMKFKLNTCIQYLVKLSRI